MNFSLSLSLSLSLFLYFVQNVRPLVLPASSYRLQDEQVDHLEARPGGLRVLHSDRWEYGMGLAHTSLSLDHCNQGA